MSPLLRCKTGLFLMLGFGMSGSQKKVDRVFDVLHTGKKN